jgi:hypothetical protein
VLNSRKGTVTCVISWCVISLIHRLMSSFLLWSHVLSLINIWSNVAHLSLRWRSIWVLGIEYELLSIVSQISNTVIKTVNMSLHRFHSLSALAFLSGHFHPEVHEEHVFCMATLQLFLFLFFVVDRAFNTERVLKCWYVSILKISGIGHIDHLFVVRHARVVNCCWLRTSRLEPLRIMSWQNSLF